MEGHHDNDDNVVVPNPALVQMLRDIAFQAGFDPDQAVILPKLSIILEAVGGRDLDLAATLYWDDFMATTLDVLAQRADNALPVQQHPQPPLRNPSPQQHNHESSNSNNNDGDGDDKHEDVDNNLEMINHQQIHHQPLPRLPPNQLPQQEAAGAGAGAAESIQAEQRVENEGNNDDVMVVEDASPLVRRLEEAFSRHVAAVAASAYAVIENRRRLPRPPPLPKSSVMKRTRAESENRTRNQNHNNESFIPASIWAERLPSPTGLGLDALDAEEESTRAAWNDWLRQLGKIPLQDQEHNRPQQSQHGPFLSPMNPPLPRVLERQPVQLPLPYHHHSSSSGNRSIWEFLQAQILSADWPPHSSLSKKSTTAAAAATSIASVALGKRRRGESNDDERNNNAYDIPSDIENLQQTLMKRRVAALSSNVFEEQTLRDRGDVNLSATLNLSLADSRHSQREAVKQQEKDEDDAYLSDNDWIWDGIVTTLSSPAFFQIAQNDKGSSKRSSMGVPSRLLWGIYPSQCEASVTWTTSPMSNIGVDSSGRSNIEETSNIIMDDLDDDPSLALSSSSAQNQNSFNSYNSSNNKNSQNTMGIPRTWLAARFACPDSTTCADVTVRLQPPSEVDLSFFAWQQQIQRNTPPPPYHCRSLTAIMSIVTATIFTGASLSQISGIGGGRFGSGRRPAPITTALTATPFFMLPKEQRKREFEARLVDALSSLLYIAAQASITRKQRMLNKFKPFLLKPPLHHQQKYGATSATTTLTTTVNVDDEPHLVTWNRLQNKLNLIPTCSWEVDPSTGEVRIEEGMPLQLKTSFTHIEDIRCYVLANLKSFTASGGVALFLETIFKIHGHGAIAHMLRPQKCKPAPNDFLICCTCEDRHAKQLYAQQQRNLLGSTAACSASGLGSSVCSAAQVRPATSKTDSTPLNIDCISVEMISLFVTGNVHSSWQGWDTGSLEFGFLSYPSSPNYSVGKELSRPKKPVWVLIGPSSYSVLCMVGCRDNPEKFAQEDVTGAVAHMQHFNCWYTQKKAAISFRLTVGRPIAGCNSSELLTDTTTQPINKANQEKTYPAVQGLLRRQNANARGTLIRNEAKVVDSDLTFTTCELDHIMIHPDDSKFYPNQYKLWRYIISSANVVDEENSNQKQPPKSWIPFFRLNTNEKLMVEAKLGPTIQRILLTRWPRTSTLDVFDPSDSLPDL